MFSERGQRRASSRGCRARARGAAHGINRYILYRVSRERPDVTAHLSRSRRRGRRRLRALVLGVRARRSSASPSDSCRPTRRRACLAPCGTRARDGPARAGADGCALAADVPTPPPCLRGALRGARERHRAGAAGPELAVRLTRLHGPHAGARGGGPWLRRGAAGGRGTGEHGQRAAAPSGAAGRASRTTTAGTGSRTSSSEGPPRLRDRRRQRRRASRLRRRGSGEDYFHGPRIGIWGWETNTIPARWQRAFALVEEIWVYSRFMAENIGARRPGAGDRPAAARAATAGKTCVPTAPGTCPSGFLFLFVFDYLSTIQRKNPVGLIEAFKLAFAPGRGAAAADQDDQRAAAPAGSEEEVLWAADGRPDIHVIDRSLETARAERPDGGVATATSRCTEPRASG